ncbi:MAG TPA: pilus assembly protein TadG-related protein [Candidatus Dormibacteraeota bacterium]|nr:pilus assembly protein TadG-related protein [Candidatus Dormibacteraeota bacterium]
MYRSARGWRAEATTSSAGDERRAKAQQTRLQKGQAIVLIALLIMVLFAMLGLAIDSGRAYVDRRDQQSAVDAAALAAGDWYENFQDLTGSAVPQAKQIYATNLHLYAGPTSDVHSFTNVGVNNNLRQDTWVTTYAGGYQLTTVATDTQFNGYEFQLSTTHGLPLAFMQIFGGPVNVTINATATAIVGNQRQTPALLTLSNGNCALTLTGSADLTVLGDTYTNGTACVDNNLHEAGNCYGAAGSNCNVAQYFCYNATPGFIPYPPPCAPGDTQGNAVVPAPALPDPGYLAPSHVYYAAPGAYSPYNRGTYTEMGPGVYGNFHLTGGSASCAFMTGGVYTWASGYASDATGSLLSNELKAPDEESASAPGTAAIANPQFWDMNGTGCAGHFSVVNGAAQTVTAGPACTNLSPLTPAVCHSGVSDTLSRNNKWGVELTSVRFDTFDDPTVTPNPCFGAPGCRRESAPSACKLTPNAVVGALHAPSMIGITINITQNAPGAQYYNVYINPNGCDGIQDNFGFVGRYNAPGFTNGVPTGTYPSGPAWALGAASAGATPAGGASVYDLNDTQIPNPSVACFAQIRTTNCKPPIDENPPQCFSSCPPPAGLLSQENADMDLQYPPYEGGDVANENYCVPSPNPGNVNAPCQSSKVTPGAVQFYFPNGSCLSQNAQGATYVFAGEQYNWIVIYQVPGSSCSNTLNGGASTQFIGTIYTPSADWTISGGNRSPLAGQVIAWTAKVSGSASVGIDFNPNYAPAPPAARLIN